MKRLAWIGEPGERPDSPADDLDIGGARASLGAAEFLHQLRMIALRLGDVLRVEVAELLRRGRRQRQRRRGEQEDSFLRINCHLPFRPK